MVIAIIGENCTGKSALADKLKADYFAAVYTGKDYLRLAKNEADAVNAFKNLLANAVNGGNIIYVISEKAQINLLPDGCFKIQVTAGLHKIKERFAARMGGTLPAAVENMLEKNYGKFNDISCNFHCTENSDYRDLAKELKNFGV